MQTRSKGYFFLPLTLLCLAYLGFEFFFNQYAMISVDEFWFAHRIYEYKDGLPYRDFAPYKTVIGYYLLLLPMLSVKGILNTLIFTKNAIAVFNTLVLFISATWLTRFFSPRGVLGSVALLVCMEVMLTYSTNIRVDLIAYWFCLFSLLLLLENRCFWAGLIIGLAFATSQKAIWYIFATNAALGCHWLLTERNRKYFMSAVYFNLGALAVIAAYLITWAQISSWQTVTNSVFLEASAMYHLDWYNASRPFYWAMTLLFNPLAFLLWPVTFISLLASYKQDRTYYPRRFLIIYSSTILLCLIAYKQVFPYYMQVTLPAFLVLYAAFFTWLEGLCKKPQKISISYPRALSAVCLVSVFVIFASVSILELPLAYSLICLAPILLTTLVVDRKRFSAPTRSAMQSVLILTMLFVGGAYPLTVYLAKLININGAYQKANLAAMNTLLRDGSDYTAGIELIYDKKQPIAGLRHLMGPAIDYLYHPTNKLRAVMTASLYEDPDATIDSVNHALRDSNVKFYVNNYRMHALPKAIRAQLDQQFQHYWGSIYLYAPKVDAGKQKVNVKFKGEYYLQAKTKQPIIINGKTFQSNDHIILEKGITTTNAENQFRLVLVPTETGLQLNPKFSHDEWQRIIS